jgi:hypothetical protein
MTLGPFCRLSDFAGSVTAWAAQRVPTGTAYVYCDVTLSQSSVVSAVLL